MVLQISWSGGFEAGTNAAIPTFSEETLYDLPGDYRGMRAD